MAGFEVIPEVSSAGPPLLQRSGPTASALRYHLPDLRHERRPHRHRPSEFFIQVIPTLGATGDMLFDSEHFGLGKFFQGVALQVGHGFKITDFKRPGREQQSQARTSGFTTD
jgi:hypothetical protein